MTESQNQRRSAVNFRVVSGAVQFFLIAGFSVVNLVFGALNLGLVFPVGLTLLQLIAAVADGQELSVRIVLGLASLVLLGFFLLCGYFGRRGRAWAFLAGGAIYLLDAALGMLVGDWLSALFHVFFLFYIVRGLLALRGATKS
ncbi:MAG: hypothetical protein FWF18_02440 [Dehalococcoidia bacterium]|nr:hypothetical protein [Dehalococcoidia bacterium]